MSYKLLLIGDAHLTKCYDQAVSDKQDTNFGFTSSWVKDIQQLKDLEIKLKDLNKDKQLPSAVLILCGGYDILLGNDSKWVLERLVKNVDFLISTGVKYVVICSIIDKWEKEDTLKDTTIKTLNRNAARKFKTKKNLYFINIRPPGDPNSFLQTDDHYYLQPDGYRHVYKKIHLILTTTIFNELVKLPINIKEKVPQPTKLKEADQPKTNSELGIPMGKRLMDFKNVLLNDHKRLTDEEKTLTIEYKSIESKLNQTRNELKEIQETYKKLYGTSIL